MKKSIRPPVNWQDFESLCKKLFGEIWNCPLKIKKNGRLGQTQAGVDVYAIPSGYKNYWGIQCKGKDNYSNSKLTTKEIDTELVKAKKFKPTLETFIFCTTALKDSAIEEYIRTKDIENRQNGSFEVLLYSWEDIADFIEENRSTFNWYVDRNQFQDMFGVNVDFFGVDNELIVKPKFKKIITLYTTESTIDEVCGRFSPLNNRFFPNLLHHPMLGPKQTNHSWCEITIVITNTGSSVLEDWKFYLYFDQNISKIDDDFSPGYLVSANAYKYRTTWAYEEDNKILYSPLEHKPLIQKDKRVFKSFFIPKTGIKTTTIRWELLARNYDIKGKVIFDIHSEYECEKKTVKVDSKSEEREEVVFDELIEYDEKY